MVGAPQVTLAFLSDGPLPPATSPFHKRAAIIAMSALDCVGALAFLAACLALIVVSRRLCGEVRLAGFGARRSTGGCGTGWPARNSRMWPPCVACLLQPESAPQQHIWSIPTRLMSALSPSTITASMSPGCRTMRRLTSWQPSAASMAR